MVHIVVVSEVHPWKNFLGPVVLVVLFQDLRMFNIQSEKDDEVFFTNLECGHFGVPENEAYDLVTL